MRFCPLKCVPWDALLATRAPPHLAETRPHLSRGADGQEGVGTTGEHPLPVNEQHPDVVLALHLRRESSTGIYCQTKSSQPDLHHSTKVELGDLWIFFCVLSKMILQSYKHYCQTFSSGRLMHIYFVHEGNFWHIDIKAGLGCLCLHQYICIYNDMQLILQLSLFHLP